MTSQEHQRDALTGAILQLTHNAERLAALDEREATHYRELAGRLAETAPQLAETSARARQAHESATRQADAFAALDDLSRQVAALATRLSDMAATRGSYGDEEDGQTYHPGATPRWWKIDGEERNQALTRLRAWVDQIYRPGFGHLAAALGPCWEHHPLCLHGLDWLMELWSVLYLPLDRTAAMLASQAEWQSRLLPALAEQMYHETSRCQHAQQARGRRDSETVNPYRQ